MLHAGKTPAGDDREAGARDRPAPGELVVLVTGHSNLQITYLGMLVCVVSRVWRVCRHVTLPLTETPRSPRTEAGRTQQNKFGSFSHDEMLAAPFGTKIYSRDRKGFVMMLRPTPELWTDSLPHRTQIIYNTDISNIIMRLALVPGDIAVESGTGSGSMTHSLARAVGPTGHVYSFDYHAQRVEQAAVEFKRHGMANVTVAAADVCADGFALPPVLSACDARTITHTHTHTRSPPSPATPSSHIRVCTPTACCWTCRIHGLLFPTLSELSRTWGAWPPIRRALSRCAHHSPTLSPPPLPPLSAIRQRALSFLYRAGVLPSVSVYAYITRTR